jgi:hypothetical protein
MSLGWLFQEAPSRGASIQWFGTVANPTAGIPTDLTGQAIVGTTDPVMHLCNPLAVRPLPPMSSTEGMRLLRMRRAQDEPLSTRWASGATWHRGRRHSPDCGQSNILAAGEAPLWVSGNAENAIVTAISARTARQRSGTGATVRHVAQARRLALAELVRKKQQEGWPHQDIEPDELLAPPPPGRWRSEHARDGSCNRYKHWHAA